jgi:acyl-CoA thioester hydrolase
LAIITPMDQLGLEDFPLQTYDKLRYADTDRQGHVNNATFSTFLETGRVGFLYDPDFRLLSEGFSFVIVSLQLNFIKEINWPGQVDIGTGLQKIGNSSIKVFQQLFQNGECVASAETVIVQVDNASRGSSPLSEHAKAVLSRWLINKD